VASRWQVDLMARRYVDLMALRAAFQRSGLPVAEPATVTPAPPPDTVTVTKRDPPEPDPPRCRWVTGWREPEQRPGWDYNPWSKERLK
jgi:hypothetical protein